MCCNLDVSLGLLGLCQLGTMPLGTLHSLPLNENGSSCHLMWLIVELVEMLLNAALEAPQDWGHGLAH